MDIPSATHHVVSHASEKNLPRGRFGQGKWGKKPGEELEEEEYGRYGEEVRG